MYAPSPRLYPTPSVRSFALALLLAVLVGLVPFAQRLPVPAAPLVPAAPQWGKLPLAFVPNRGQSDPRVQFQAQGMGGTLLFTSSEVVLALPAPQPAAPDQPTAPQAHAAPSAPPTAVRVQFPGAQAATVAGTAALPGVVNYFVGNDPAQWHSNVPTYGSIVYNQIYPGIDLHYDGTDGNLKGTYHVAAGAAPDQIRWRYDGATGVSVAANGDLQIRLPNEQILTEHAPVAWQTVAGEQIPVAARFAVAADGSVGFTLGAYNTALPLVIDPILVYSTFLGGSGNAYGRGIGITVDAAGSAYVTGQTRPGLGFTTTPGAFDRTRNGERDMFVMKLNPAGTAVVYSTYLGGSAPDDVYDIKVDAAGNAYVTGKTVSPNFPTTPGTYDRSFTGDVNVFITKLNPQGTALVYSTFLGGRSNEGSGIAVDAAGNAYVAGVTYAADFPTTPGAYDRTYNDTVPSSGDAFVSVFNARGTALVYSTFLGGSTSDFGTGIAVDANNNAYITGWTGSADFPTTPSAVDRSNGGRNTFVTKLNAQGTAPMYSTFLGGGSNEGSGIAVDAAGNAYVAGSTYTSDFPTTPEAFARTYQGGSADAFVTKLNPQGTARLYSTLLGGADYDYSTGIAVHSSGTAYVTGYTASSNFPTTPDAFPSYGFGGFVAALNMQGSALVYSTYLGGSTDSDTRLLGGADIAVDTAGNSYITGATRSADFSTTPGAYDRTLYWSDGFAVKIADGAVARDSFSRTVTNGWGSAMQGGPYTITGTAANYSVANGVGTQRVATAGSGTAALLPQAQALNADARVRITTDKLAAGAGQFAYVVLRNVATNTEYRAQLRFEVGGQVRVKLARAVNNGETTLGAITTVPSIRYEPATYVWLRAQADGTNPTTLRVKAWADGQAEPADWLLTATDATPALQAPGAVGLRAYLGPAATNAPVRVTFDDLVVLGVQP